MKMKLVAVLVRVSEVERRRLEVWRKSKESDRMGYCQASRASNMRSEAFFASYRGIYTIFLHIGYVHQ